MRYYDEETKKYFTRVEKEDHYTVTDGDGIYVTHITKPGNSLDEEDKDEENDVELEEEVDEDSVVNQHESESVLNKDVEKKPAEVMARLLVKSIQEHGLDATVDLLGADSTVSNTGWKAGTIAWMEKLLGRKFHWLICMIHTNELGLRCLIQKLDGKTDSRGGFSGPLGKLLKKVPNMKHNPNFKSISVGPDLIYLPPEIVKSLIRC